MFDRQGFIEDCQQALAEHGPQQAMREVVERAVATPDELFGTFTPAQGGIQVVHKAPDLTILHVVWAAAMSIYPHDHRMPAVIGLYAGQEDNYFYRRSALGLEHHNGKTLLAGDAVVLGRDVIHSVTNPRKALACAIHVYCGDFFGTARSEWDSETLQERPYNVETALRLFDEANRRARAAAAR